MCLRDSRRWEHEKKTEAKGQMVPLSPMEEKWIYGNLTIQVASKFYPFARKDQDKDGCLPFVLFVKIDPRNEPGLAPLSHTKVVSSP